jgi:malate dehydrogenase
MITDSHRVLTVSTFLDGEIEMVEDVSLGVPAVITKNGVAMIVPIHMNHIEKKEFLAAARTVRDATQEVLDNIDI